MYIELSNYSIEEKIGEGGMATVYRAVQKSLQRDVALKVLNPLHSNTPEFTRRFLNEGRIVAALNHSNIVTIHDIGVEAGLHFIAMELLTGGDLKQRIRRGIPVETALRYLETIAGALNAAHRQDIVHRDVKPTNVLFRADGTLVLSDFGIAKRLGGDDLTVTGSTIGSPHYLSPEQARGKTVDARADIYSLGVLLYEMLTRRKPYKGASDIDTVLMHVSEPVPQLPPEFAALQPLIDRMLAKAASDRFASAAVLVAALAQARTAWRGAHDDPTPATAGETREFNGTLDLGFHEAPTMERAAGVDARDGDEAPATEGAVDADASDFHEAPTLEPVPATSKRPRHRLVAGTITAIVLLVLGGTLLLRESPTSAQDTENLPDDSASAPTTVTSPTAPSPAEATASAPTSGTSPAIPSPAEAAASAPTSATSPAIPPPAEAAASTPEAAPSPAIPSPAETAASAPEAVTAAVAASAPAPMPEPVAQEPPPPSKEESDAVAIAQRDVLVAALLLTADEAMADFRLTRPAGNNALEYIERALKLDPHSAAARAAFARIADRYVVLARSSIAKGERDKARLYVARGLEVNPDNTDLHALDTELGSAPAEESEVATGEQPATTETRRGVQGETPAELFDRVKRFLTE